jgi:hypothetical protein
MRPRESVVPRWDGKPAPDRSLLIHGEQGFGDNIQFARFIDEATRRVGQVFVELRGPLLGLFQGLRTTRPFTVVEQGRHKTKTDLEIALLSLPRVFGTTVATIPSPADFRIDPADVARWRATLPADRTRVGLIWQGNPTARADQGRSPPLAALEPLFSVPETAFVSLQMADGLDQIAKSPFAKDILVPGAKLGDFRETAAAILALDLVVSSCTATLHLAASLGVPVLGMLKYHADWRWLNERDDSPWYPSLRLFRQKTVGDWQSVAGPVAQALAEFVARR